MSKITLIFSLVLMFCLSACMTAGEATEADRLNGLWKDENGQFFYLEEGGRLGLPRNVEASGASWDYSDNILTLTTVKSPAVEPGSQVLMLQKRGLFSVEFLDAEGKKVKWSRSFKKVKSFEGTLFFRERMMLPPEVTVSVQLRRPDGGALVGQSIAVVSSHEELGFRVDYLKSDLKEKAVVEAAIFYGKEPLFSTPAGTEVALNERPAVLLHHAVPLQQKSVPLEGTYWRLKELNGTPAESFADQPEAHLILNEGGQATGSDGCNNFFMDWKKEDSQLTFLPGGATLRLCPNGEEQAQKMLQMFPAVKSWNIRDGQLELHSADKLEALLEAVEM